MFFLKKWGPLVVCNKPRERDLFKKLHCINREYQDDSDGSKNGNHATKNHDPFNNFLLSVSCFWHYLLSIESNCNRFDPTTDLFSKTDPVILLVNRS